MAKVGFGENHRAWQKRVRDEVWSNWQKSSQNGLHAPSFGDAEKYPKGASNCYAYALGITVAKLETVFLDDRQTVTDDSDVGFYYPGFISGEFNTNRIILSDEELIARVYSDLAFLGLKATKVGLSKPDNVVPTISVYNEDPVTSDISDFHFLRTNREGFPSHKRGYHEAPRKFSLDDVGWLLGKYHPVADLEITMNR